MFRRSNHCTCAGVGALLVLLAPALVAHAQLRPGSAAPSGSTLQSRGGPATIVRYDDAGRARIAWRMQLPTRGADAEARARDALGRVGGAFGVGGMDLRLEHVLEAHGRTNVRFRRFAMDRPVVGATVVVRMDEDGVVDLVSADPGSAEIDRAAARMTASEAERASTSRLSRRWPAARAFDARAVAWDTGRRVVRAWAVEVQGAGAHERAMLYWDARDGTLRFGRSLVHDALGRVFDTNPVTAGEETSDVELQHLTSLTRLTGRYVRASSCAAVGSECDPDQRAIADDDGNFLFEPDDPAYDDPFAEVSAYFHTDRAAGYFRDAHGFEWSCCESTSVIDVVANYVETPGVAYDNAAYSPTSCSRDACGTIVLGQGRNKDFAYDGEVVYHEYSHAIVDATAGIAGFSVDPQLGVGFEPGAINEGTADYFAATIAGDSAVAEYFAGTSGGIGGGEASLRDLDNELECSTDLFGEVHADGRIWGAALWRIRAELGAEVADAMTFGALAAMGDSPTFDDGASLVVATAEAMREEGTLTADDVATVEAALERHGVTGCERIVPLDDEMPHRGYSGDPFATANFGGGVAPLHYKIDVPADATELTLSLSRLTAAGSYTVYLRDGMPALYRSARTPPLIADSVHESVGEVVLTDETEHALPRCDTLYLALTADDLERSGPSIYELQATLERSGDPDAPCPSADAGSAPADAGAPDAGVAPDAGAVADAGGDAPELEPGGGGCGCRSSGAGSSGAAWLGALGLAGWLARRRRR